MRKHRHSWEVAANKALSPLLFEAERERVAVEIAARLAMRTAGAGFASAIWFGSTGLQRQIFRLISDEAVRASLATRHIDGLYDHLRAADYEDVRPVADEAHWIENYLNPILLPFLAASGTERKLADTPEIVENWYADRLLGALATHVGSQIDLSGVSAA